MKGLILFTLFLGCLSQSVSGAPPSTGTFDDGNKLYEQKQYSKALRAYEGLIHQGNISSAILFNAGNAAFKSKQLGHAMCATAKHKDLPHVIPISRRTSNLRAMQREIPSVERILPNVSRECSLSTN